MGSPDKKDESAAVVLGKLLSRDDVTSEQLIEMLRLTRPSAEVETERIRGEFQHRQPWYVVAPWAALFTLIGTLGAAWTTGYFEKDKAQDAQNHAVNLEGLRFRSATFERLLVIDGAALGFDGDATADDLLKAADVERKARICLAQTFGLIEIPEFVVGYPRASKDYKDAVDAIMNHRFKCDNAEVPTALPGPISAPSTRADCAAPERRETPAGISAISAAVDPATPAGIMVRRAIGELGVDENCDPDRIRAYFASLDSKTPAETVLQIPWSAVFISWLIREAGNPASMSMSMSHMVQWNSAVARGVAIPGPDVAPLPGDIVFWSMPAQNENIDIEEIRSGENTSWSGFGGIVLSFEDENVIVVVGNLNNRVAIRRRSLTLADFVGVIRF